MIYDDNDIQIEGDTSLTSSENVGARFAAHGWSTATVDGRDHRAIESALTTALPGRPHVVVATLR